MRKSIRFIYWFMMSVMFLLLVFREYKLNQLNCIDLDG